MTRTRAVVQRELDTKKKQIEKAEHRVEELAEAISELEDEIEEIRRSEYTYSRGDFAEDDQGRVWVCTSVSYIPSHVHPYQFRLLAQENLRTDFNKGGCANLREGLSLTYIQFGPALKGTFTEK